MFVETQASQSEGVGTGSAGSQSSSMGGQVRATQGTLEFSQTQAPGSGTGVTPDSDQHPRLLFSRIDEDAFCILHMLYIEHSVLNTVIRSRKT